MNKNWMRGRRCSGEVANGSSSRDDDASNQHIVRIRDFFARLSMSSRQTSIASRILARAGHRFALRIAAGNGRTNHDISAVVFVGFEKDFEIACGH
jgi:hypothetical protein